MRGLRVIATSRQDRYNLQARLRPLPIITDVHFDSRPGANPSHVLYLACQNFMARPGQPYRVERGVHALIYSKHLPRISFISVLALPFVYAPQSTVGAHGHAVGVVGHALLQGETL